MRAVLAACLFLSGVSNLSAQVQTKEQRFGNGRITEVIVPNIAPTNEPKVVRDPAPFGHLQIREWHFDPKQKYRYWLEDVQGNTWFVVFQSSGEDFSRFPRDIYGWIMEIDGGCLRIGTNRGSTLVPSKDLKGKGIPASFSIDRPAAKP